MALEALVPGAGITLNETGTFEAVVPGIGGGVNQTVSVGGGVAAISTTTADSTVSSSAHVSPLAALSAITANSVFSGSAQSTSGATLATTTANSTFSGSAYVSPLAAITTSTADSTFVGSASVGPAATLNQTDIDLIAAAVWAKALNGAFTAEQMQRIMFSALAGRRAGIGTATESYYDVADGITQRIALTPDSNGNGTPTVNGA